MFIVDKISVEYNVQRYLNIKYYIELPLTKFSAVSKRGCVCVLSLYK